GTRMDLDLQALETSFDLVASRGDVLMDVFYARLFAAAPAVKPLFAGTDPRRQKAMLLGALVRLRGSLRGPPAFVPPLPRPGAGPGGEAPLRRHRSPAPEGHAARGPRAAAWLPARPAGVRSGAATPRGQARRLWRPAGALPGGRRGPDRLHGRGRGRGLAARGCAGGDRKST